MFLSIMALYLKTYMSNISVQIIGHLFETGRLWEQENAMSNVAIYKINSRYQKQWGYFADEAKTVYLTDDLDISPPFIFCDLFQRSGAVVFFIHDVSVD